MKLLDFSLTQEEVALACRLKLSWNAAVMERQPSKLNVRPHWRMRRWQRNIKKCPYLEKRDDKPVLKKSIKLKSFCNRDSFTKIPLSDRANKLSKVHTWWKPNVCIDEKFEDENLINEGPQDRWKIYWKEEFTNQLFLNNYDERLVLSYKLKILTSSSQDSNTNTWHGFRSDISKMKYRGIWRIPSTAMT